MCAVSQTPGNVLLGRECDGDEKKQPIAIHWTLRANAGSQASAYPNVDWENEE